MDFSCPHGSIKLPFPSPQRNHSLAEHYGNLKQTKIKLEYCKPTYNIFKWEINSQGLRKKKYISLSYYIKDFIHRTVSWKRVASTQNCNNAFEKNDFWWL